MVKYIAMKGTIDTEVFHSTTHGILSVNEAASLIKNFLEERPNAVYKLVIGTDSQEKNGSTHGRKSINAVTAVIVHRKGFGGKYFWKRTKVDTIHSLREKIYTETMLSLEFATEFVPLIKRVLNGNTPKYFLEIHVDVGEHGDTRDMIKEVVGMVTGNGFVAKTKPDAYGASYIADKHA